MEALGGERVKEYFNKETNCVIVDYNIDVKKSLEIYKDIYEPFTIINDELVDEMKKVKV